MKTKIVTSLVAVALASAALGQTSTWFYGATNNSTNYGVTPTNSQAVTWMDNWAGGADPELTKYNTESLQASRPDLEGLEQGIIMYGFGGLGITAAEVTSASLYLTHDYSYPESAPNTWNIVGIAAGNSNWDTNKMTWGDLDTSTTADWTGGTLLGSLTGNYGTFQDFGNINDIKFSIDITAALKAYLDGTISGIAFVNSNPTDAFGGANYAFSPFSDNSVTATNRPGLLVNIAPVPEPSSSLLALSGALVLLLRRRR